MLCFARSNGAFASDDKRLMIPSFLTQPVKTVNVDLTCWLYYLLHATLYVLMLNVCASKNLFVTTGIVSAVWFAEKLALNLLCCILSEWSSNNKRARLNRDGDRSVAKPYLDWRGMHCWERAGWRGVRCETDPTFLTRRRRRVGRPHFLTWHRTWRGTGENSIQWDPMMHR